MGGFKRSRCLFALIGLLGGLTAQAEAPVWALRGAHNTVYLAGSVHVLKSPDAKLPAAFDRAWRAAEGESAWITNRPGAADQRHDYAPPLPIARGDDLMAFHLGSTVVLLFEQPVTFTSAIVPGAEVTMGRALGSF